MNKKTIILIAAILLVSTIVAVIVVATNFNNNTPTESNQPPTSEVTSELPPTSDEPVVSEQSPDLIVVDNTPADVYVDIEAGDNNPANHLPWLVDADIRERYDDNRYLIAMNYIEIDLYDDYFMHWNIGFTWIEILQVEPPCLKIQNVSEELQNLPHRKIQNRDAARVVANEIGDGAWTLKEIMHDPTKNIWIFRFGTEPLMPSLGMSYAVNGYNGQVIRGWIS